MPDVKLAFGELLRLGEEIRIGNVFLNDLILIFLPVFELVPHVLWICTVLSHRFDDGDTCASGAGNGLDDPQRSIIIIESIVFSEYLMVMQDQHEKAVINAIVIDAKVLMPVIVKVE